MKRILPLAFLCILFASLAGAQNVRIMQRPQLGEDARFTQLSCPDMVQPGNPCLKYDRNHCGFPRRACPANDACVEGNCVNLQTDGNNCGRAGNACKRPASACIDGSCVDVQTDPKNCGNPRNACKSPASLCAAGKCVDPLKDLNNCGKPGYACKIPAETCVGGRCLNTQTDSNNCGIPGNVCKAGPCVAGKCVDPLTDLNNCGKLGNACKSPANACIGGACVNTLSDPKHCGMSAAWVEDCTAKGVTHGVPLCTGGSCMFVCNTGWSGTLCQNKM